MVLLFCLSFCLFLSNCSTNRLNISIYLTQNLIKIGKFRILVQTSNPQTSYGTKVGLINVGLTNIRLVQTSDQYNNYINKVVFSVCSFVCLSVFLFVCLLVSQEPLDRFASNFDRELWRPMGMFLTLRIVDEWVDFYSENLVSW